MKQVATNYLGGFSLTHTPDELKGVIENTRDVTASFNQDTSGAYQELVGKHVDRCIRANVVPTFPKLEEWEEMPFFTSPNIPTSPVTTGRTFILWNMELAGIYDDINLLVSDFESVGTLSLIEVKDEFQAVERINCLYKEKIYKVLPYIVDDLPFLAGPVPKNCLHRMPYIPILQKALKIMPAEIHTLAPCTLKSKGHLQPLKAPDDNAKPALIQVAEII